MPKVSIIVPVYGVEKLIERCARSLFEQTLDDIEYLFIDDCTTDKSIDVLKRVLEDYPKRKPQVVIHRMDQNSGQAAVRKWGMLNAKGDYVIHCDSDDWVEKDIYEVLYNLAAVNQADMVSCNFFEERECGTKIFNKIISEKDSNITLLKRILCDVGHLNPLWTLLISKDLCKNIVFPSSNQSEDFAMISQFIMQSKKRAVTTKPLYHYTINQQSISHDPDKEKCLKRLNDAINNRQLVYNIINKSDYKDMVEKEIIVSKAMTKYFVIRLKKDSDFKPLWNSIFPEVNNKILFTVGIPCKLKFFHLLVQFNNLYLYRILRFYPTFR